MSSRINLMNAVRSFHLDKERTVKFALASDVKCKNWGQEHTLKVLQDFDNSISASLEKEIDEALAGNTEPTLAMFKELSKYKDSDKEAGRSYFEWEYDFLMYIRQGNRKNALWLATHLKQCLIFYSLHVDKELFVRNIILENVFFKEHEYGINEEYYNFIKKKIKNEQRNPFEKWVLEKTETLEHGENAFKFLKTYYLDFRSNSSCYFKIFPNI